MKINKLIRRSMLDPEIHDIKVRTSAHLRLLIGFRGFLFSSFEDFEEEENFN